MTSTWAKFYLRIIQRVPTHACSSWASGSSRQIARNRTTISGATFACSVNFFAPLFEAFRFRWGKAFRTPDPMHFEYAG